MPDETTYSITLLRADEPRLAFSPPPVTISKALRPVPAILNAVEATAGQAVTLFWERTETPHHCFLEIFDPERISDWKAVAPMLWPVGPFARFGWRNRLREWVRQIGPFETGNCLQISGEHNACMIRFGPTSGPIVWFKAVPTGENEFGVTCAVARAFPRYSVALLGIHADWRGWLSEDIPGEHLSIDMPLKRWCDSVRTLAEIQVECMNLTGELLTAGCANHSVGALLAYAGSIIEIGGDLMARQTTVGPPPLNRDDLRDAMCWMRDLLNEKSLPETLTHNDWGPHNTLIEPSGAVRLIDWAGASISHPLVTIERLFAKIKTSWPHRTQWIEPLRKAYEAPWIDAFGTPRVRRAWRSSAAIAVFVRAVRHAEFWLADPIAEQSREKVIRSLLRQTKAELDHLRKEGVIYATTC